LIVNFEPHRLKNVIFKEFIGILFTHSYVIYVEQSVFK
jgi:hypothetical protein